MRWGRENITQPAWETPRDKPPYRRRHRELPNHNYVFVHVHVQGHIHSHIWNLKESQPSSAEEWEIGCVFGVVVSNSIHFYYDEQTAVFFFFLFVELPNSVVIFFIMLLLHRALFFMFPKFLLPLWLVRLNCFGGDRGLNSKAETRLGCLLPCCFFPTFFPRCSSVLCAPQPKNSKWGPRPETRDSRPATATWDQRPETRPG